MRPTLPWVGSLVGLVAVGVAATRWLSRHQPHHFNAAGLATAVICITLFATIASQRWANQHMGFARAQRNFLMVISGCVLALIPEFVTTSLAALTVVDGLFLVYAVTLVSYNIRVAGLKQCPDCAETVKANAHICRYCRYRFQPGPIDPD